MNNNSNSTRNSNKALEEKLLFLKQRYIDIFPRVSLMLILIITYFLSRMQSQGTFRVFLAGLFSGSCFSLAYVSNIFKQVLRIQNGATERPPLVEGRGREEDTESEIELELEDLVDERGDEKGDEKGINNDENPSNESTEKEEEEEENLKENIAAVIKQLTELECCSKYEEAYKLAKGSLSRFCNENNKKSLEIFKLVWRCAQLGYQFATNQGWYVLFYGSLSLILYFYLDYFFKFVLFWLVFLFFCLDSFFSYGKLMTLFFDQIQT